MRGSVLASVVILAAGVALLVWGFNASESISSGVSEVVQGAPSNKAIVLIGIGAIVSAVGAVKLLRKA